MTRWASSWTSPTWWGSHPMANGESSKGASGMGWSGDDQICEKIGNIRNMKMWMPGKWSTRRWCLVLQPSLCPERGCRCTHIVFLSDSASVFASVFVVVFFFAFTFVFAFVFLLHKSKRCFLLDVELKNLFFGARRYCPNFLSKLVIWMKIPLV